MEIDSLKEHMTSRIFDVRKSLRPQVTHLLQAPKFLCSALPGCNNYWKYILAKPLAMLTKQVCFIDIKYFEVIVMITRSFNFVFLHKYSIKYSK
jgi:hypothetical protein